MNGEMRGKMAVITIKIQNKDGMTLSVARGEDEAALVYTKEYEEGDEIIFEISPKNAFYELMADDALGAATVYVTGDVHYRIPFGERKISYSPKTFSGNRHLITAKLADMTCFGSCRNLAKNVMDQHGETNCYPHASANVETRGEAVFAARNAIDGVTVNAEPRETGDREAYGFRHLLPEYCTPDCRHGSRNTGLSSSQRDVLQILLAESCRKAGVGCVIEARVLQKSG